MIDLTSGRCPVCSGKLKLSRLVCPDCSAEYPADRLLSPYDDLSREDSEFLKAFLTCRGNMKDVQVSCGISYPTAKKRLDSLLAALGFIDDRKEEMIDMRIFSATEKDSMRASDIVRNKLYENGGQATVYSVTGIPYTIRANPDGKTFFSEALPIKPNYDYSVFDVIVEKLLMKQGNHQARKGNARNDKLGTGDCTEDTVAGTIGIHYFGKPLGTSIYDPVFVLAAVLDWAGIAHNGRGYIKLTADYCAKRMK